MKFKDISEARRNPEQNPRETIVDMYKKYGNDPDVFVSFTMSFNDRQVRASTRQRGIEKHENGKVVTNGNFRGQSKVGINPKSLYQTTPIGIYSYRLSDYYSKHPEVFTSSRFPYVNDMPNVYFLRRKGGYVDDISKLGSGDFSDYRSKLRGSLRKEFKNLSEDDIVSSMEKLQHYADESAQNDYNNTSPGAVLWKMVFLFSMAYKKRETIKSPNELSQMFFEHVRNAKISDYDAIVWNVIWRKVCGVESVNDGGAGIIHSNEMAQNVFFSKNGFDTIDLSKNHPQLHSAHVQLMKVQNVAMFDAFVSRNKITPENFSDISFNGPKDMAEEWLHDGKSELFCHFMRWMDSLSLTRDILRNTLNYKYFTDDAFKVLMEFLMKYELTTLPSDADKVSAEKIFREYLGVLCENKELVLKAGVDIKFTNINLMSHFIPPFKLFCHTRIMFPGLCLEEIESVLKRIKSASPEKWKEMQPLVIKTLLTGVGKFSTKIFSMYNLKKSNIDYFTKSVSTGEEFSSEYYKRVAGL